MITITILINKITGLLSSTAKQRRTITTTTNNVPREVTTPTARPEPALKREHRETTMSNHIEQRRPDPPGRAPSQEPALQPPQLTRQQETEIRLELEMIHE